MVERFQNFDIHNPLGCPLIEQQLSRIITLCDESHVCNVIYTLQVAHFPYIYAPNASGADAATLRVVEENYYVRSSIRCELVVIAHSIL